MAKRTLQQNKSLHVLFSILADEMNSAGLDQRKVLKPGIEIPWTPDAVKEMLWKPVMKGVTGKTSTKDLEKQMEIDEVHEILMKHLGEKFGLEYIDFPHNEDIISNYATVK